MVTLSLVPNKHAVLDLREHQASWATRARAKRWWPVSWARWWWRWEWWRCPKKWKREWRKRRLWHKKMATFVGNFSCWELPPFWYPVKWWDARKLIISTSLQTWGETKGWKSSNCRPRCKVWRRERRWTHPWSSKKQREWKLGRFLRQKSALGSSERWQVEQKCFKLIQIPQSLYWLFANPQFGPNVWSPKAEVRQFECPLFIIVQCKWGFHPNEHMAHIFILTAEVGTCS